MEESTQHIPFYNIRSKLLRDILGVKKFQSVKDQLNAIGVPIYRKGKDKYIISEDVMKALGEGESDDYSSSYYSNDPKLKDFF